MVLAFPWPYRWFPPFFPFRAWITSLLTNAKSSLFTIFWPISSVVHSSLCQELSALCWSCIPISKSICFGRCSLYPADLIKLDHHHDHQQGDFCQPQTPLVFQIRYKVHFKKSIQKFLYRFLNLFCRKDSGFYCCFFPLIKSTRAAISFDSHVDVSADSHIRQLWFKEGFEFC